ncbi:drug/metabolite transporter (DMT)-like permease [Rhodobium orientis]|uniref:EamA family transporter n=1 Tax=Rhodobium orientis TaxID=34017 RepID=A0A327JHA1_9HYPH|nr:DMT family transporter [Rhodobium orientis]MBB4303842.1 drug/metabolite transporter (DMT)-like permease [Rhodobium orientis]MBK5947960.1 EamA family transporter [Rhodobium orientis]RAI25321.1 EamA family transporter [Rhodobium orientis]
MTAASRPFAAALWMLGAIASFSAMAVAGREIAAELDTFELMAYRSVIGLAIVVAVIAVAGRFGEVKTQRAGLHLLRNIFHFSAQNLWFFGIATIPLAQLVALEFTNPIWVAVLAPFILLEPLTRWRVLAAVCGFFGVLIIARPGVVPLEWGHAAGLACALGFALNTMLTKRLSRTDSTLCILFWMTASQSVMGFACALPGGMTMFSAGLAPWVVVVGICGLSAHYCLTMALSCAPASVVAPIEFARLPVIAILGLLVYGEPLEVWVFVGGAVIVAGNLVNVFAEQRRARPAAS